MVQCACFFKLNHCGIVSNFSSGREIDTVLLNTDTTWTAGPNLPTNLAQHCMASISKVKTILAGGSHIGNTISDEVHIYDWDLHVWTQKASLPTPIYMMDCEKFKLSTGQEVVIVAGGQINIGAPSIVATDIVQLFDIAAETWSYGPTLPETRMGGKVVNTGGRFIQLAGKNDTNAHSRLMFELSPDGSSWSTMEEQIPVPKASVCVVAYNYDD